MRAGASSLQLSSSATSTTADIQLAAADRIDLFASSMALSTSSASAGDIKIDSAGTFTLSTSRNNTNILFLPGTGNIGIGTTAPAEKLHIETSDGTDAGIKARSNNASGDPFIQFTTNAQDWYAGVDNSDSDKFMIGSDFAVGTDPHITIQTDGNVGIGTTSPGYNLDIQGAPAVSADFNGLSVQRTTGGE